MVASMDTPDSDNTDLMPELGERIAKRLARAGLCSRRDAERWIAEGRIAVNGTVLDSPAFVVRPGDIILADGKPIPEPEPARLWRYHKPAGLVTSARDEKGRATVFDKLPESLPRVVSIGRLDLTTEGLLLLTNDGELARFLEMPTTGWTRRYRVRVFGEVNEVALSNLAKGPTIDGVKYGPIEATLDRIQGRNAWLSVALKEGKNREIRRVMESMDLQVNRLIRVSYGPFQLGKLEEGAVEEVPKRVVREQIAPFFTGGTMAGDINGKPSSGKGSKSAKSVTARPEAGDTDLANISERKPAAAKKAPASARSGLSRATLERVDSFKSGEAKTGWAKADRSAVAKTHGARSSGPRAALARTGVSEKPSDDVRNEDRRNEGRRNEGRGSDGKGAGGKGFASKEPGKKDFKGKQASGRSFDKPETGRGEGRKGGFRPDVTPEDTERSDRPRGGRKTFDGKPGAPRKREFGEGTAGRVGKSDSGRGEAGWGDGRKGGFRSDGIRADSERSEAKRGDTRRSDSKAGDRRSEGKGPEGKSFGGKPSAPRKREFGEGADGRDRPVNGGKPAAGKPGNKPFGPKDPGAKGPGSRPSRDGGGGSGKPGGKSAGAAGGERAPRREGRPGADRRR